MDEADRFLKARQERDEQRASRPKEVSEETRQRERFEAQMTTREADIAALVKAGNPDDAETALNAMRALVQDTSSTIRLTAHDMAKSNATVVRLQQEIDQCRGGGGSENGAGGGGGTKRFKFSSKAKANVVNQAPSAAEQADAAASETAGSSSSIASFQPPAHGDVYGPHSGSEPLVLRPSKAVFVRECTDTTVLSFPIAGSAFFFGCRNCVIYLACHQLRMKDCHNVAVYVWCASKPIIESCDAMTFGPYTCWKGLLGSPLPGTDGVKAASTAQWVGEVGDIRISDETERNYTNVDDFQWLRKTQSPHWRVLAPEEYQECATICPTVAASAD